jgi:8-oxo-dGTP pyrophosphatase MutT (NUDIX family)
MKNYCIIDNEGREHWISRSIAVVVFVFAKDIFNQEYILAEQRGKGTPDPEYIGKYCVPCGYLDYDETIVQAAQRELMEETGLNLPISDFKLLNFNDIPESDKRQNVTFRYIVNSNVPVEDLSKLFTTKNSEKDEVSSIKFISLININNYEWAFNHQELIKEISLKKEKATAL